jgi:branched-chain amino acid aminotransferase
MMEETESDGEPSIDWDTLTFSFTETDRMYIATCKQGEDWGPGIMQDFQDLSLSPAAGVINYGQGLFEGMKARRAEDGRVLLFRPELNARRAQDGCKRLGMSVVPEEMFLDAVNLVVQENIRWLPPNGRGELYIRPLIFGSGSILGVAPAPEYTFLVYVVPVGPYFKGGLNPISLKVSDEYHRAAPGGSGGVKAIGNYAPGMMPSKNAKADGYAEIIYLDAVNHRYVEEVGAANFFCIKDKVLYTPELTGTILPGITRLSVIELARSLGYQVLETKVDIDFAMDADEAFCAGTAAVISPIGSIEHGGNIATYCDGEVGAITKQLYDALTAIQEGRTTDTFGWTPSV